MNLEGKYCIRSRKRRNDGKGMKVEEGKNEEQSREGRKERTEERTTDREIMDGENGRERGPIRNEGNKEVGGMVDGEESSERRHRRRQENGKVMVERIYSKGGKRKGR